MWALLIVGLLEVWRALLEGPFGGPFGRPFWEPFWGGLLQVFGRDAAAAEERLAAILQGCAPLFLRPFFKGPLEGPFGGPFCGPFWRALLGESSG